MVKTVPCKAWALLQIDSCSVHIIARQLFLKILFKVCQMREIFRIFGYLVECCGAGKGQEHTLASAQLLQ